MGLFSRKNTKNGEIYAPVSGRCVALSEVPDEVFSSGIMGEGAAFSFEGDTIFSPVSGRVSLVADTKHAVGIVCDNHAELLIHVGTDTVELEGQGFTALVKAGAKVKVGTPLLKIDRAFMASRNISLITPVVVTDPGGRTLAVTGVGTDVTAADSVVMTLA